MKKTFKLLFLLGLALMSSCSEDDFVITKDTSQKETKIKLSRNNLSIGIENAVKKARQMTDLSFTPINPIEYNTGTFQPGVTYKGIIYSSVKETETFVGENISIHTFITAVNNPRSKLYTERVNQYPYHGTNCKAYYGTVCSGLVSYALGLVPRYATFDFPESDLMDIVDHTSPENLQVADVLWREGHVALITDIISDDNKKVSTIEISETPNTKCKRYTVSRDKFQNEIMGQNFKRIYRYKDIENNTSFTPISDSDFTNGEKLAICADKGDKSCYLEGEDVVINILTEECDSIELYKDGKLYMAYSQLVDKNIILKNLTYGDYMARIVHNESTGMNPPKMNSRSTRQSNMSNCETYWKVVNTEVKFDKSNNLLHFNSSNARPLYAICCREDGTRPHLKNGFYHVFSDDDIFNGHIDVDRKKMDANYPYIKVFFETDYGLIINKPINWCE